MRQEAKNKEVKKEKVQKSLENAEKKLDKAIKENPQSKDKILPILEKTREVKEHVKEDKPSNRFFP